MCNTKAVPVVWNDFVGSLKDRHWDCIKKGLHDSAAFLWFPGSTEWLMIREQRGRLPHNPEEPSREGRENPLLDSSLSYSSFFCDSSK